MILDSNVLIALLDPDAPESLLARFAVLSEQHQPAINEIVFAEIARGFADADEVERVLEATGIRLVRLTLQECHRAGLAFAEYRARGGERSTILPDFLIGAQAATRGWPLVTRDRRGFGTYFPELKLIDPLDDAND